jgi:polysaccharide export outer membrane protein
MSFKRIKNLIVFTLLFSLFACNYNSSRMMKTSKDYEFKDPPSATSEEYVITPSDIIDFKLYTNDGSQLIDLTAIAGENVGRNANALSPQFLIEFDGFVRLPIIGRIDVKGKTINELQTLLEELYAKYYVKPFVLVKVVNKRVTVFPGGGGKAQVVALVNDNMRIIEALGAVGGITKLGKAAKIKLVRGNLKNPQVFLFDFTSLEGIQESDFVLQANDIIYVEPRSDYFQELVRDIAPIVSLITSAVTLIIVINNINKQ